MNPRCRHFVVSQGRCTSALPVQIRRFYCHTYSEPHRWPHSFDHSCFCYKKTPSEHRQAQPQLKDVWVNAEVGWPSTSLLLCVCGTDCLGIDPRSLEVYLIFVAGPRNFHVDPQNLQMALHSCFQNASPRRRLSLRRHFPVYPRRL